MGKREGVTMWRALGVLFVLLTAWPAGAAGAAEQMSMPEFDPVMICPYAQVRDGCMRNQLGAKKYLSEHPPETRLLRYCIADAEYHRTGYLGIQFCVLRVRHEAQMATVEKAFGAIGPITHYCSSAVPGTAINREFERCEERERLAYYELKYLARVFPEDILDACISRAVRQGDRGKSWKLISSCLIDESNKRS
jgi:hypothetical protein